MKIKGEVFKVEQGTEWINVTVGNVRSPSDARWRAYRYNVVLSVPERLAKGVGIGRVVEMTVKFK